MITQRMLVGLVLSTCFLIACAGAESLLAETPAPEGGGAPELISPQAAQPTPPASTGRDVSTVNMCEVLPAVEAAAAVGTVVFRDVAQTGPTCVYQFGSDADSFESYNAYLVTPDVTEALIPFLVQDGVQDVGGLGDEAYLNESDEYNRFQLHVLVRGEFGLEVIGPREEVVRLLTEELLRRLGT